MTKQQQETQIDSRAADRQIRHSPFSKEPDYVSYSSISKATRDPTRSKCYVNWDPRIARRV